MMETRSGRSARAKITVPVIFQDRRSPAVSVVLYGRSVFVITFSKKLSPGPKKDLERRVSQFSVICAKNQVLNLIIDKVIAILVTQMPLRSPPPVLNLA